MKTRLLVPLLCIVLLALGLLGWMGWQMWRTDRAAQADRLQSLLAGRLLDFARRIDEVVRTHEDRLELLLLEIPATGPSDWRSWALGERLVRQVFLLDEAGDWLWPRADDPGLSEREREFLRRAESLAGGGFAAAVGRRPGEDGGLPERGWRDWYHGDGRHWAVWRSEGDGSRVSGIELERMAFVADVIEALPFDGLLFAQAPRPADGVEFAKRAANPVEGGPLGQVAYRLIDERGQVVHRWGGEGLDDEDAAAQVLSWRELGVPLAGWRVEALGSMQVLVGPGNRAFLFLLSSALLASALVVVALAWFLWHQQKAELREAEQRVNFVNQVSHELRTPLTNIGLYSELLQDRLPKGDAKALHYGEVIGSEVGRLGRLIHNVLSFSARERGQPLAVQRQPTVPDEIVGRVLECFAPTLSQRGIEVEWKPGAGEAVELDPDLFEQILSNLVSNVEKYAASGRWLGITTGLEGDRLRVKVSDRGPGVPLRDRERVFRPFLRLSDALNEGVSGAGLGLGIVRELARAHGGTVRCVGGPGGLGAVFEVELETVRNSADSNGARPGL